MVRRVAILAIACASLFATTLEKLSLDDMVQKSTSIVRGKVVATSSYQRGSLIYTSYQLRVSERIKGQAPDLLEVSVPGGNYGKFHQTIPGAPTLLPGQEYVVFVWTGSKGINHIIGLCQGLFTVGLDAKGQTTLSRGASNAEMLDSTGRTVTDEALSMSLRDLTQRVKAQGAGR